MYTLKYGGGGGGGGPGPQKFFFGGGGVGGCGGGGLVSKKIFSVLRASVCSKNKTAGPFPGSATEEL